MPTSGTSVRAGFGGAGLSLDDHRRAQGEIPAEGDDGDDLDRVIDADEGRVERRREIRGHGDLEGDRRALGGAAFVDGVRPAIDLGGTGGAVDERAFDGARAELDAAEPAIAEPRDRDGARERAALGQTSIFERELDHRVIAALIAGLGREHPRLRRGGRAGRRAQRDDVFLVPVGPPRDVDAHRELVLDGAEPAAVRGRRVARQVEEDGLRRAARREHAPGKTFSESKDLPSMKLAGRRIFRC